MMIKTPKNLSISQIGDMLKKNDKYLIICHTKPDGDTLGSGFALKYCLEALGKAAYCICDDKIPDRLKFICNGNYLISKDHLPDDFVAEFIISVDIASTKLMGTYEEIYGDSIDLMIDHHSSNSFFGKYSHTNNLSASTGEIIYDIALTLVDKFPYLAAVALYSAISSDTGCFKYSNVTSSTHIKTANLITYDINHSKINHDLFENKPISQINATKVALNSLRFFLNNRIAVINFPTQLKNEFGFTEDDISDLSSIPQQIQGVDVGIIIKQSIKRPNIYKISMRSNNKIDSSELCAIFGGGGHKRAAGCAIEADSADEAERIILNVVMEEIQK